MRSFVVYWAIDIEEAEDAEDAARQAKAHFDRPRSIAHVFHVMPSAKPRDERFAAIEREAELIDLDHIDGVPDA